MPDGKLTRGRPTQGGVSADARVATDPPNGMGPDALEFRNETVFMLALAILLFSMLDGVFTVLLTETGRVQEWNPVMAVLLDRDLRLFAATKSVITHTGVFLLVAFLHLRLFGRVPARRILELVFGAYLLIVVYHLVLTFMVT